MSKKIKMGKEETGQVTLSPSQFGIKVLSALSKVLGSDFGKFKVMMEFEGRKIGGEAEIKSLVFKIIDQKLKKTEIVVDPKAFMDELKRV